MNLFSLTKLIKLYLSLYLSPSTIPSQFRYCRPEYFHIETNQNMVGCINRNGGFTAIRWYKYETINDRTLVKNSNNINSRNNNNADNQVNVSEINYCIVQLIPIYQKILDPSHLIGMGLE